MTGKIYHPEQKHPQPYQEDLNPSAGAGLNYGEAGAPVPTRSAIDVKFMHQHFQDLTDDELKQIQVLEEGARLETDATYLRITEEGPEPYHARGDENIVDGDIYLPKRGMPYQLWNRLVDEH